MKRSQMAKLVSTAWMISLISIGGCSPTAIQTAVDATKDKKDAPTTSNSATLASGTSVTSPTGAAQAPSGTASAPTSSSPSSGATATNAGTSLQIAEGASIKFDGHLLNIKNKGTLTALYTGPGRMVISVQAEGYTIAFNFSTIIGSRLKPGFKETDTDFAASVIAQNFLTPTKYNRQRFVGPQIRRYNNALDYSGHCHSCPRFDL